MKTYQLILASALVALAACTKEEVVNTDVNLDSNEIGFNAVTQRATKANDAIISGTTYATDGTNTFQVWGWQSAKDGNSGDNIAFSDVNNNAASNFMSNLTISYCGGRLHRDAAWRNADNYYYWPFTGKISFLAVHPSTVASSVTAKWDAENKKPKATIADYTITPDSNETTDLMFATNEGSRQADPLNMVFKHALSQIEVQVKTDQDYSADVAFDVESVTFNNIDLSGDVAYVNNVISWSDNAAQTQSWVYCNDVLEDITKDYQVYGAAKVMIPQLANTLNPDATPDPDTVQATITIGYSMEQTGSAKITGTVTIADPFLSVAANQWEAGKKYNYTINFRLNEILFNPSVTDWVDVDVTTINIY